MFVSSFVYTCVGTCVGRKWREKNATDKDGDGTAGGGFKRQWMHAEVDTESDGYSFSGGWSAEQFGIGLLLIQGANGCVGEIWQAAATPYYSTVMVYDT